VNLAEGDSQSMQIYRFETTVKKDGTLAIKGLPFSPGEKVEVIVRRQEDKTITYNKYSLRGKPVRYQDPFESISEEDWDALK
jgi:hypothetical protein